jgi:uncharacterized protein
MGRPTINGVKALLTSKFRVVTNLAINWFGGEPLLALPVVEEISEHILSLLAIHEHVMYSGFMTTNAYLLEPKTFERLVALGIANYQVSLDGDEDVHDLTRRMLNGRSSFARIWENLQYIHSSKSLARDILLRVHLCRDNISSARKLIDRIVSEFGGDDRFKLFLKPIERLGGPNDADLPILTRGQETSVVRQLAEAVSSKIFVLNLQPEADPYVCYAAKANSLAIRADGRIAKCTVALYDDRNSIGKLQENGTVILNRERLLPWLRGLESTDPKELACPYHGMASAK